MQPDNLLDYFLQWEEQLPDRIFLRQAIDGQWKTWTWAQAGDESRRLAQAMITQGLQPGDRLAILSKNCAQWFIADLAIMMGGFISVPLYPTLSSPHIRQILEHSGARLVFLGKLDDFASQQPGIPEGCLTVGNKLYHQPGQTIWEDMVESTEPLTETYHWRPDELCTIIYTSGTTGDSKGVMHNMGNFEETMRMVFIELDLPMHPRLFSYLPLSHIAERLAIENYGIRAGAEISFAESLDTFNANLAETQPDLFVAVPRIWDKFREGILQKMPQQKLDLLLRLPLVSGMVKKMIRKKLGLGRSRLFLTGAAPISAQLQEWFFKIGIDILQVYGMTEDCVYAHMNRPGQNRFGTVGKPLPGLQVKFGPDGEIRVKAPGVFQGYYKDPLLTSQAFDDEGFLCTGDMGEYDQDGYLIITGRVKDQFKTDKGKYIDPAPIELRLQNHTLVDQACVIGTGIPQPICLLVLSEEAISRRKQDISAHLEDLLQSVNQQLEKHERLEKAVIVPGWTVENEFLTPTLKLRRSAIEKNYGHRIGEWHASDEKIIWLAP
jgi:long-chain acyl-CoA synthetase